MTGFSEKVRDLVRHRAMDYNHSFAVCEVMAHCQGYPAAAHLHHRRPRGAGGSRRADTNQAANSLACCFDDHHWLENHRAEAYRYGWLLRQHQTPSEVPVLRRGVWVLLTDAGECIHVAAPAGGAVA